MNMYIETKIKGVCCLMQTRLMHITRQDMNFTITITRNKQILEREVRSYT